MFLGAFRSLGSSARDRQEANLFLFFAWVVSKNVSNEICVIKYEIFQGREMKN